MGIEFIDIEGNKEDVVKGILDFIEDAQKVKTNRGAEVERLQINGSIGHGPLVVGLLGTATEGDK